MTLSVYHRMEMASRIIQTDEIEEAAKILRFDDPTIAVVLRIGMLIFP
jgi:hypothetical protein